MAGNWFAQADASVIRQRFTRTVSQYQRIEHENDTDNNSLGFPYDESYSNMRADIQTVNLNVSLEAGYRFNNLMLSGGLQLGTLLSSEQVANFARSEPYPHTPPNYSWDPEAGQGLANTQVGLTAAAFYQLPYNLNAGLRLSRQLNSVYEEQYEYAGAVTPTTITLSLGYTLGW